jgi:hypothetical protein
MFHTVKPSGSGFLVLRKQGSWLSKGAQVEAERASSLAIFERRASHGTCQLGRYVPRAKKVMYTEHIDLHFALACSTWVTNVEKCKSLYAHCNTGTVPGQSKQRKCVSRLGMRHPVNGYKAWIGQRLNVFSAAHAVGELHQSVAKIGVVTRSSSSPLASGI